MTISSLFIRRPRLAFVISTVITIAGIIAMTAMPVAQFPDIVPPQVRVTDDLSRRLGPGGRGKRGAGHRAQVNGVERMIYMKSTSGGDGSYAHVSFEVGSNPDSTPSTSTTASTAPCAQLPPEVQRWASR
jgi:multidrug efflux pump subunit AcrB